MTVTVSPASTPEDFDAFGAMVGAYVDWCRSRYADDTFFVDQVFGHQALAGELSGLAAKYTPPNGRALILREDGEACGAVAYRSLGDGIAEMKRMFVSDRHHGKGHGRRLCAAVIAAAEQDGYRLLRLDTATRLTEAITLYESQGFRRCPAYNEYPEALEPYIIFMERPLGTARA